VNISHKYPELGTIIRYFKRLNKRLREKFTFDTVFSGLRYPICGFWPLFELQEALTTPALITGIPLFRRVLPALYVFNLGS
jgi:hypothetical protein